MGNAGKIQLANTPRIRAIGPLASDMKLLNCLENNHPKRIMNDAILDTFRPSHNSRLSSGTSDKGSCISAILLLPSKTVIAVIKVSNRHTTVRY